MKKKLSFLIAIALVLSGCGAAETDVESTISTTEHATIAPITEATELQTESQSNITAAAPMITVSVPVISSDTSASDGTVIFRAVTQNMQLVMQDPDVADRIIVDFLNRIDQVAATHEETVQQAKSAYLPSDSWVPYLSSITYAPQRIDQSVLSLYGNNVHYTGSAHAIVAPCAANYNVITGDVLTLGSIITDENALAQLCDLTIQSLTDVKEEKYLYDGFEDMVRNRFGTDESYDENWYFSTNGLCFYFDPYSIAPYSSGIVVAEIPYEALPGIIDDAFFPPEQEDHSGKIMIANATEVDMSQFARISEVVLKPEAPMYVVYTDTSVQNVRITMTDAELGNSYTVFAAQFLSTGDAVVVQTNANLFHRLDIIYQSDGQTVTMPLLTE